MIPKTIQEAKQQILAGTLTLTDLVEQYFTNIDASNEEINAFVYLNKEDALKQAQSIQKKVDAGNHGPLLGAIMGIKDVICEKGKPTTCASEILGDFHSVYDATVIDRLKAADAILIGRVNMDEFAMGSTNEYSRYGAAKNPHDTSKVTGGSSGGSAAAVAANMANTTLGSDTGGSIRQPASYCGVVGIKPTYGRVSRYGLVAFASSFDSIGPLAHSVEDAAAVLQTIAGFDERDNTSAQLDVPDYIAAAQNPTKNIKIGVPEEFFGEGLDEGVKAIVEANIKKLEENGAEIVPIHLPHTKYGLATYYILATAEASSNLARFDGIRYGHRADKNEVLDELKAEEAEIKARLKAASDNEKPLIESELEKLDSALTRLYKKSRTEGFGPEVKRRIMLGTYVLSAGYYDAYYGKAQRVRRLIQNDFKEAFEQVDVIACPTAPTTAFDIGSEIDDPLQMYLNDAYTISANLAGICGISVPAGTHENGLPVGIQFLGDVFQEEKIINAGRLVEMLR
ncbi:MAG: Asp-tRNA(Asn)/Glu-tRNA(Gln) amidotransferase subunit GatA [Balneolaceae bacterium]|nr:Asp-tRNA(Asn)/Glu-tRNA(Gln) amidotransferase subunit GatA [Balneolaceae bacterium]